MHSADAPLVQFGGFHFGPPPEAVRAAHARRARSGRDRRAGGEPTQSRADMARDHRSARTVDGYRVTASTYLSPPYEMKPHRDGAMAVAGGRCAAPSQRVSAAGAGSGADVEGGTDDAVDDR
jgi:hypothetical protein